MSNHCSTNVSIGDFADERTVGDVMVTPFDENHIIAGSQHLVVNFITVLSDRCERDSEHVIAFGALDSDRQIASAGVFGRHLRVSDRNGS